MLKWEIRQQNSKKTTEMNAKGEESNPSNHSPHRTPRSVSCYLWNSFLERYSPSSIPPRCDTQRCQERSTAALYLLDVRCDVLLDVVLLQCLRSALHSVLLHLLRHVRVFDHCLSVTHGCLQRARHAVLRSHTAAPSGSRGPARLRGLRRAAGQRFCGRATGPAAPRPSPSPQPPPCSPSAAQGHRPTVPREGRMRAALAGPDVATHRAQLPERPAGPSPSQELTQPGALPPGSPPRPSPFHERGAGGALTNRRAADRRRKANAHRNQPLAPPSRRFNRPARVAPASRCLQPRPLRAAHQPLVIVAAAPRAHWLRAGSLTAFYSCIFFRTRVHRGRCHSDVCAGR